MASLDSIGKPKAELLNQQLTECDQILSDFGTSLIRDSKAKLLRAKGRETELASSITTTLTFTTFKFGKPLEIQVTMDDYWKYVDGKGSQWGRRPNKRPPPIKEIEKWIGTNPSVQAKFGRDKPRKTIAFLIARSIGRKGIKATPFWTDTINDGRIQKLNRDMSVCFARDIDVIIDKTLN